LKKEVEQMSSHSRTSVMIVDDHPLYRAGLRSVLERERDLVIVAEATDGEQALDLARKFKPQVILSEANLPKLNGLEVTRQVTTGQNHPAVIILTAFAGGLQRLNAFRAGAQAFFPKDADPRKLPGAIRQVAQGNCVLNGAVISPTQAGVSLKTQIEQSASAADAIAESAFESLSTREGQILGCIVRGRCNKEIAQSLGIRRQTVKNHMNSLMRKLHAKGRTQAAIYALQNGWVRQEN
jgi:DNA-binding NarL/FixJ family response regulator